MNKKIVSIAMSAVAVIAGFGSVNSIEVLAGPPEKMEPAEVAGVYTNSDGEDLYLNSDGTLTVGDYSCNYTVQKETDPGGNVSYPVSLDVDSSDEYVAMGFPWYGGTYNIDPSSMTYEIEGDVMGALITDKDDYYSTSFKNSCSDTGYTTLITIEDKGYDNVYVYGMWEPKEYPDDVNDESTYSDETYDVSEWKNGMYYYGQSAIKAEKNASGDWVVAVDLASSIMNVVAFHDVEDESDLSMLMIDEGDYVTVEVPWDPVKQSDSNNLTMAFNNKTAAGNVEYSIPWVASDGTQIKLSVYTPYGYDQTDSSILYPVVYMIPGAGTTEKTFFENCKANNIFDNYTQAGTVSPTVVVTMEGENAKDYLTSEIIPYIEANYNVATDAAHRTLFGISMGSVNSSLIYLDENQVDMFSRYCFLSGADKNVFGVNDLNYEYADYDEEYLEKLDAPIIFIGAGGKDDFNMFEGQGASTGTYYMKQWFDHYGIDVGYSVVPGNHHWESWVPLTIEFVGEYLSDDAWVPVYVNN